MQLEAQLLHRKRDGQLEGLSKEQRRLHTAGKMLHQFCTGTASGGSTFTGSNLVRCDPLPGARVRHDCSSLWQP